MLADFYIPRLSNDIKIAVQKNLVGQIWYRNVDPVKKRRQYSLYRFRENQHEKSCFIKTEKE